MRVVLDTNILVSYLLTQGKTLSRIIDHWERGSFVVLISPAMLGELKDVLQRPRLRPYMSADPQALLEVLEYDAEQVPGELVLTGVCRDPKDDIFIACAVEGDADFLVSGDEDLLVLDNYQGIRMVSPAPPFVAFKSVLAYTAVAYGCLRSPLWQIVVYGQIMARAGALFKIERQESD